MADIQETNWEMPGVQPTDERGFLNSQYLWNIKLDIILSMFYTCIRR
jgi:hypothetical protein